MSTRNLDRTEEALFSHTAVLDCAVLSRQDLDHHSILTAYLVLTERARLPDIEDHLERTLPAELRPGILIPVSRLPRHRSGVLDELALQDLPAIGPDIQQSWSARLSSSPEVESVEVAIEDVGEQSEDLQLPAWILDLTRPVERVEAPMPDSAGPKISSSKARSKRSISEGGPLPSEFPMVDTLQEMLIRAAEAKESQGLIHILPDGTEVRQSYGELLEEASRVLAGLRGAGVEPGDNILLQLPGSGEFLAAFWGCVLVGAVPVPVSIAPAYDTTNAVVQKLGNAWNLLKPPFVLASGELANAVAGIGDLLSLDGFEVLDLERIRAQPPDRQIHPAQPEDLALMMLTSGSTGMPKSVMLSHRNLVRRSAAAGLFNGYTAADVSLNWMAMDHVAGLVYFHLRDVSLGCLQVHGPTEPVLQDPLKWMDWIHRHRVTVTFAPNFAYGLVNVRAEAMSKQRWDLSCVRHFHNGGEAIVAKTARRFMELLTPYGLSDNAMRPAWGMSETCSAATLSDRFTRDSTTDEDSFVSVGKPIPELTIRVVDPQNRIVDEGVEGQLQVRGMPVTSGYYENPEKTAESFSDDGWFRTGDLGIIEDGALTITGRDKGDIVIHGINYQSHEIESVVEDLEGVATSFTAATAIRQAGTDTDQLAVFFCAESDDPRVGIDLVARVRRRIIDAMGVSPAFVVPVARQDIPKTNIGKIQRGKLGQALIDGAFDDVVRRQEGLGETDSLPSWFYVPVWHRSVLRVRRFEQTEHSDPQSVWLVFEDEFGLARAFSTEMERQGHDCVVIEQGDTFAKKDLRRFQLRAAVPEDLRLLMEEVEADGLVVAGAVHFGPWAAISRTVDSHGGETDSVDQAVSFLFLLQALAPVAQEGQAPLRLVVVSGAEQSVVSGDCIEIGSSPARGLMRSATQEMPRLEARFVDLDRASFEDPIGSVPMLLDEVLGGSRDSDVAFRNGERWVLGLERVGASDADRRPRLVEGGHYLITGGLGGVGFELAKHLLQVWQADLLLVGRTEVPNEASGGAEECRDRFERLEMLRSLGTSSGSVRYEPLDICNFADLEAAVERSRLESDRPLDGVFHLAGEFEERLVVEESRETLHSILRPKLEGTLRLHELFDKKDDPLFVVFSSVNGFFGGYGVGAYSAANSYLDSFACRQRSLGKENCFSLAWSLWDETGMSRGYAMKELSRTKGYYPISPQQGLRSLLLALGFDRPWILIGLEGTSMSIRPMVVGSAFATLRLRAVVTLKPGITELVDEGLDAIPDRFGLSTEGEIRLSNASRDAAPAGAVEGQEGAKELATEPEILVSKVWQEILKIGAVGPTDNFFDLGGDSVSVAQVSRRLGEEFGRTVSMTDVFRCPTVRSLALELAGNPSEDSLREMEKSRSRGEKRRRAGKRRRGRRENGEG